jgi:hypothetical protein
VEENVLKGSELFPGSGKEGEFTMKKLLALLLVLGLASMANAALVIKAYESDGTTPYGTDARGDGRTLEESDYLTLKLEAIDGDTGDYGGFALVADTSTGTISGGTCVIPPAPDASMHLGSASSNAVGMPSGWDGIVGTVGAYTAQPPYPDGVYFDEILFHCEGNGQCTVGLYDISTTWDIQDGLFDSIKINQVPEPMTLSLLGLGGLALLRRRR